MARQAGETLAADDPRYKAMFNVGQQDANRGVDDRNYVEEMNRLREKAPVMAGSVRALLGVPEIDAAHYIGPPRDSYSVFSYHACERAFRENLTFSSAVMKESVGISAIGSTILEMVGNEHKRYRAVGQPLFLRPRVLDWWKRRWIDDAVDSLLDRLTDQDAVDLNMELCAQLPMHVVTRAIGVVGTDALTFRRHLTDSSFGQHLVTKEQAAFARQEVDRMLGELVAQRREQPGDDVISGFLENDLRLPDGTSRKLTDQEIFSYCKLIIFAGGGTTWRQLGITIDALLSHYHFWEECRENRTLIEPAIDEALRWRPTDPIFPRLVTQDVEVEGIMIPEGVRLNICLGAGNRDPKVWDRPDEFDIHRPKTHHLGLGIGPHRCLGMDVAKQEMAAAINGLMDRWPNMRIDPDKPAPRFVGLDHCGMSAITVRLKS